MQANTIIANKLHVKLRIHKTFFETNTSNTGIYKEHYLASSSHVQHVDIEFILKAI